MKKPVSVLLTTAILTGMFATQIAKAEDAKKDSGDNMASGKNGCKGMKAGDKNCCKGMKDDDKKACEAKHEKKDKKGDKNSCKNGCGEAKNKDEKKDK